MKFLNNVDINKNQAISLGLEISSSHPASPVVGQVYFNTSDNLVYVYDGTSWNSVAGGLKTARIVIGASTVGWTSSDCDYLCDGTADDVEINAAITALPATGGEIVILDGTYNITATIDVTKDNVSIIGNGNATILKRMYDSSTEEEGVITLAGRDGCKIADLQVDGNRSIHNVGSNFGIFLMSSTNSTVTGNACTSNDTGIILVFSSNNAIIGNTCNDSPDFGIQLYSSSNNTVTGNTCNNNDYSGIYLSSSSGNNITGNTCNNNDYSGIYLRGSSEGSNNNTITGNTCNNNDSGIFLENSSNNNSVTGNTYNNNDFGIQLYSSSNNTVTGNTCNNNNDSGIYLDSSSNNTINGNTCIRDTGSAEDYTVIQHTIRITGTTNSYNLIAMNNCMGKAVTNEGGTGNTLVNNKFDAT